MSTVNKPYTFSPNTSAASSEVNSNFDTIYNDYNGSVNASNLATGAVTTAKIADSAITTAKIADSNVTFDKVAAGMPVQMVSTSSTAVATGTTTTPLDDTIPQITEGTEFMTLAITPKSSTNILVIDVIAFLYIGTADRFAVGALHQDTTADALAGATVYNDPTSTTPNLMMPLRHTMVAGTTSATTFKFRAGPHSAATITFNGRAGGRSLGAITKSSIVITEYKA